jgi:hypothetical protein
VKTFIIQAAALAAFGTLFGVNANAQCGFSKNQQFVTLMDQAKRGVAAVTGTPIANERTPAAEDSPRDAGDANRIVGLWHTVFTSGGQTVDEGFDMWTSDGLEVLNDTPPPATGNVCLGVWAKTGGNTIKLNHPSWTFDANGNLNGTAVIKETISVDPGNNSFKGTFTIDIFTLQGQNVFHLEGTVAATRITVN